MIIKQNATLQMGTQQEKILGKQNTLNEKHLLIRRLSFVANKFFVRPTSLPR